MAHYSFLTVWKINSPIEKVYDTIRESQQWPRWWSSILKVKKLKEGNSNGVGDQYFYILKGPLPFKLIFDMQITNVEKPYWLEGVASGDLVGKGCWHLEKDKDGATVVEYKWDVSLTGKLINLLAPFARPLLVWNHHAIMNHGGEGLARWLKSKLLLARNQDV